MRKNLVILMTAAIILALTATAFAAVVNKDDPNLNPMRTLDYIHLGNQVIQQEFVWDEASGTFQTVNLYTVGTVDDHIANIDDIMSSHAAGDGAIIGGDDPMAYTYYDGSEWQTYPGVIRYEGDDYRGEAIVHRYDNTYYTHSTRYWSEEIGVQTLYTTTSTYSLVRYDPYYSTVWYEQVIATGTTMVMGTFSEVLNVPAAFEPVVEVQLANGWTITITSDYTQWGNEVKITAPTGESTHVYGDPHMMQAGGTQQQELAAIGTYTFLLGDYVLNLECMKSNAGFSLVTDLNITGPNDYLMTYGRNNEVKVSGGTP